MSFGTQAFPLAVQPPPKPKAFGPDLAVRLICPDCRDPYPNIREEFGSGDLVCGNCGLVLGDRIVDTRSECRYPTFQKISFLLPLHPTLPVDDVTDGFTSFFFCLPFDEL
jgi:hypothetical protein